MFEAVIFDWDGTLANTRGVIVDSFQKALLELHCKVSDEFIERRIGIGSEETFKEILQEAKIEFDSVLISRLVENKIHAEIAMSNKVNLFEGVEDLLKSLCGKVKLALASMNNREVIDYLVREKKIRRFFNIVLTVDDIQFPKPNPEIFLKAATQLGVRAETCVVVEDSIFGVRAARSARMGCVAVLTGVYSKAELLMANPNLVVDSLNEKAKILDFILR